MKKMIIPLICFLLILGTLININKISDYLASIVSNNPTLVIKAKNQYAKEEGFTYVKLSEDYIPYSYNDLLNLIYSVINNGWTKFTFYCPSEYQACRSDLSAIASDKRTLSYLSNFVHPFNSFNSIGTKSYETGEVTIAIKYMYTREQVRLIDAEADKMLQSITSPSNSDYDNIKALHDYIINNTKYDVERNENGNSPYQSFSAYGPVFEHYATCNGYSDLMAILLTKMGIKNYKIATPPERISYKSAGHVWNAVYLNNQWLHLDLTWDDPVSDDGKDYLFHKYFLVSTQELKDVDSGDVKVEEHNFDDAVYLEFNPSI